MGDRDIPSVPVTTLAGLTSLSDLLSELPVSASLSNVTPLNKSLLFHTLVANESKNLLSVRDEYLVRQLVHAIEQTNSDNIELKPQYSIQQHGTNISAYPELLQGIYKYRPTVFNTPQRTQNDEELLRLSPHSQTRGFNAFNVQQHLTAEAHAKQQLQPTQVKVPIVKSANQQMTLFQSSFSDTVTTSAHQQLAINPNPQEQSQQPPPKESLFSATLQQLIAVLPSQKTRNSADATATTTLTFEQISLKQPQQQQGGQLPQTVDSKIKKQQLQQQLPHTSQRTCVIQAHQEQERQQCSVILATTSAIKPVLDAEQSDISNQEHQQKQLQQKQPQQMKLQQEQEHELLQPQEQKQQQQQQIQQEQQKLLLQQQKQPKPLRKQLESPDYFNQRQVQNYKLKELTKQQLEVQQQEVKKHLQQRHQSLQQRPKQHHTHNQSPQQQQVALLQPKEVLSQQLQQQIAHITPQQQAHIQQQSQTQIIQGDFRNVLNLQRQQIIAAREQQQQVQNKEHLAHWRGHLNESMQNQQVNISNELPPRGNITHSSAATLLSKAITNTTTTAATTTVTANITVTPAAIEPNKSISVKSCIDTNVMGKNCSSASSTSSDKSQVRVCINRIKSGDAHLMQQSIKGFIEKSPESAIKMGLQAQQQKITSVANIINESITMSSETLQADTAATATFVNANTLASAAAFTDTFTLMKANENLAVKRHSNLPISEIPFEQMFTQPKVRRVERIAGASTLQSSKEEVVRSQTYQQFMRNMEQIIELLDDTEIPNLDSGDIDENIECISAKMLKTMSNDVAKLKSKSALDSIPKNKLNLLINFAMRTIYLAKNYSGCRDDEDEIVDEDTMDIILNAMEACLLICNIYSTTNDLKFLQEDNISLIIKFVQFQIRETIFPSYDSVYMVKSIKKTDSRKKRTHQNNNRSLQLLYSKAVELIKVFVALFDKCIFVDTIVLPLSTLAVEPFFVDNIETLQFACLELVTTIFRKEMYEKIRSSILGDILSSIDRLPSSKKNLRPFKLMKNGGNIQMVTALVLQLIQCATVLPESLIEASGNKHDVSTHHIISLDDKIFSDGTKISAKQGVDVVVLKKYDVAISIGGNFLTTFLNKCKTRSNDTDFRPLFENFINDLLATVNKPEWPASELLLSLLGTMLVRYVSDKTIEQSIRLVSLDYLGIVAARLRKDTVESTCKVNIIDSMIKSIKSEQEKEGDLATINNKIQLDPEEERTEFLQNILLEFLAFNTNEEDLIWDYARNFYITQWYRDVIYQRRRTAAGRKVYASKKKSTARKKRRRGEALSESSGSESRDTSDNDYGENSTKNSNHAAVTDQELNWEIFNVLEERKRYLLSKIKTYSSINEMSHTTLQNMKTYIDYNNAYIIAQYLATKRPFSQSFDGYLKKIILVVNEPSIAIRTRAMKCLASIVEVDPMVLKRKDMQMGVNQKFLDTAISVREAAVDLVGKFVLSNEDLIDQYYDMLSTRILDTGVSVRKRVIKILRDICIEYPDFEKIPEICVKMIRRVNDEEGIQKLVTEVFMKMWFTPCKDNDRHGIQRKINQIIDVVNTAHDTGTTWLEGLLTSIFQPKENMKLEGVAQDSVKKNTEPPVEIVLACQQLADGLVDRLIELEDTDNSRMLGCIITLHLLAKVRPKLLVRHAITIEPYLNIKCHSAIAHKFICAVADILEQVVPLVVNPSESFLASLEEHLMLLVVSLNQAVVTSCVSCLGVLVNKITKNYKLIRDCFQKFYRILDYSRIQVVQNSHSIDSIYTPMFRRSLFTIGILMRYFDFKSPNVIGKVNPLPLTICDDAFVCLMFFTRCSNYEIRKQSLIAMGSFCVMNDDYLTRADLKTFYCDLLCSDAIDPCIKIICMRNIWIYLTESEMHMQHKEKEWEKQAQTEDLKEMNDVSSGMASRIIQLYLQEILDCFLNRDDAVRLWAVKVVQIVLRQGLVHPVRMVPYLICLSTDSKVEPAHRADALLKEIDKTYAGFVNMKVQLGLQLCFQLQELLQCNDKGNNGNVIRGYIKREADTMPSALNDFLYTLLRSTKPQRRALVQTLTKQFDDQKTSLRQMLYIADNLAYFPYVVQDEPLYLIHQIDLLISIAGTNLLATFRECLKPSEMVGDILHDDDDEEDLVVLLRRLPEDTAEIQKCITAAQACMLLLMLKQHLKDMYGLTDGKISRYSPSEMQKIYEKPVIRKIVTDFNPATIIEVIKKQQEQDIVGSTKEVTKQLLSNQEKMQLVEKYLDFKQLMLKLDPEDVDSDEEVRYVDKSKLINIAMTTGKSPTTQVLKSTKINQAVDDSCVPTTQSTSHSSGSSNYTATASLQTKEALGTPTLCAPRQTNMKSNIIRQPHRIKRKKRKLSSSDEDDEDYSDEYS